MLSSHRMVGLSVLTFALVACSGALPANNNLLAKLSPTAKPSPSATPAGELVRVGQVIYANWGGRNARGVATLEMDAGDSYFKGTFIRGEPGQQLTLKIKNVAQQGHNFSMPAQGLDQDIPHRSYRVDVAVTFPERGRLQFFCKLHTAQGMNGMLVVSGATPRSGASPQPGE